MKVIFFEIDAVNVKRYYLDVLPDIVQNSDVSILIESREEAEKLKELNSNSQIIILADKTISFLENLINDVDILFINGQRVPDIMLTLLANKVNTRTVYIQHGMYIPYMKRGILFYFKSLFKSFRYLRYSLLATKIDGNATLFFKLIRSHLIDGVREYKFNNYFGYPDVSFVFSEYWKIWHNEHYFKDDYNNFIIAGNPELLRFKQEKYSSNYIVYCYQTLIEDGRIEKKYLIDKIEEIISWVESKNKLLIVKSHPRMSREIRKYFNDKNIELVDNILPVTNIVIGHYSSLMPLWAYYGSNVFSLKLDGHYNNIDESINKTSFSIESLDQILIHWNKADRLPNSIKENVKYYFNYDLEFSPVIWNQIQKLANK